jgi:hypothetical protein
MMVNLWLVCGEAVTLDLAPFVLNEWNLFMSLDYVYIWCNVIYDSWNLFMNLDYVYIWCNVIQYDVIWIMIYLIN